ncbi:MAG: hypothetical protein J0H74_24245 [Chitinophagaceae bacterium]|nr:hypothetical protein [Chitinophagaceae bacterium]
MKKALLFAIVASMAIVSCKKDHDHPQAKIYKGSVIRFQHGSAWTWYEVDAKNKPLRLGASIDKAAMRSLDTSSPEGPGHNHENMISLLFPSQAKDTVPFLHFGLDWNPHGHEPAGVYDKPHFDFHFYMISEAERSAIPTYEEAQGEFDNYPDPSFMPENYMAIPGGVPQMGAHWVDVTSPELNGQPFTQTFLMGSYNSKVIFYEPMITEEFIRTHNTYQRAVPRPAKVQADGYYPKKMRLETTSDGTVNIVLEEFEFRLHSDPV